MVKNPNNKVRFLSCRKRTRLTSSPAQNISKSLPSSAKKSPTGWCSGANPSPCGPITTRREAGRQQQAVSVAGTVAGRQRVGQGHCGSREHRHAAKIITYEFEGMHRTPQPAKSAVSGRVDHLHSQYARYSFTDLVIGITDDRESSNETKGS